MRVDYSLRWERGECFGYQSLTLACQAATSDGRKFGLVICVDREAWAHMCQIGCQFDRFEMQIYRELVRIYTKRADRVILVGPVVADRTLAYFD